MREKTKDLRESNAQLWSVCLVHVDRPLQDMNATNDELNASTLCEEREEAFYC